MAWSNVRMAANRLPASLMNALDPAPGRDVLGGRLLAQEREVPVNQSSFPSYLPDTLYPYPLLPTRGTATTLASTLARNVIPGAHAADSGSRLYSNAQFFASRERRSAQGLSARMNATRFALSVESCDGCCSQGYPIR